MQNRDITEILKVFEKRIFKLENRVGELEATVEDLHAVQADKGSQSKIGKMGKCGGDDEVEIVDFKTLDSRFDELSLENRSAPKKVTYDKNTLLSIRPTASVDSEFTGYTDLDRSFSMDCLRLEEGEVLEPPSSACSPTASPKARTSDSEKLLRMLKPDNRRRQPRDKKPQSPRQSNSNGGGGKAGGRERAKSEPLMEALRNMKKEAATAEPPPYKTEMHYGLVVQYPPEDDK